MASKHKRSKKSEKSEKHICRFCLTPCLDFKKVEKSSHATIHLLLPTLDLTLSRDPVVCKVCSQFMQKYLMFKTLTLEVKNVLELVGKCLFCKDLCTSESSVCLNSQDLDDLLLRSMMGQYFPELNVEINANLLVICATCCKGIQKIFNFLVSWGSSEQRIQNYCRNINATQGINLKDIIAVDGGKEKCKCNVNIKQEHSENINESSSKIKVENLNDSNPTEHKEFVDQKIKLELEDTEYSKTEAVIQDVNIKLEQVEEVYIKQEVENTEDDNFDNGCDICSQTSNDETNFGNHSQNETRNVAEFKMYPKNNIDSPRPFFSKTQLLELVSQVSISGLDKYQCQVCLLITTQKSSMLRHMKLHQDPSELETFHCYNCEFKTYRKSILAKHMETHRSVQKYLYQCQHCTFSARRKETLRHHLFLHDSNADAPTYECYKCGFKVFRKRDLKSHVAEHVRQAERVPPCDDCKDSASYESNGHELKRLEVLEKGMYQCDSCGYETRYKAVFSRHLVMHRRPVKCEYCDFRTHYAAMMKRHVVKKHREKTGEKKCDESVIKSKGVGGVSNQ